MALDLNQKSLSSSKKRRFIVNLKAGKGFSDKKISILKQEIKSESLYSEIDCDWVIPESRSQTEALANSFVESGGEELVVLGGDGTINSVVNSICLSSKKEKPAISIGHFGTGNDYFRSLIEGRETANWKDVLRNGEKSQVDVGKIFFKDSGSVRYFVNMASVGLAPAIVKEKEKLPKWIPSKLKYLIPSLKTFLSFKAFPVELTIDGVSYSYRAKSVTFSKGTYAGGGMRFGESVKLDDGLLELTVFTAMNPLKMVYHFSKLYNYKKSIAGVSGIVKFKSSSIELKSAEKVAVEFDGELYGTTDIKVEVCPKMVTVFRPQRREEKRYEEKQG